jgi:hypothetical protein
MESWLYVAIGAAGVLVSLGVWLVPKIVRGVSASSLSSTLGTLREEFDAQQVAQVARDKRHAEEMDGVKLALLACETGHAKTQGQLDALTGDLAKSLIREVLAELKSQGDS